MDEDKNKFIVSVESRPKGVNEILRVTHDATLDICLSILFIFFIYVTCRRKSNG